MAAQLTHAELLKPFHANRCAVSKQMPGFFKLFFDFDLQKRTSSFVEGSQGQRQETFGDTDAGPSPVQGGSCWRSIGGSWGNGQHTPTDSPSLHAFYLNIGGSIPANLDINFQEQEVIWIYMVYQVHSGTKDIQTTLKYRHEIRQVKISQLDVGRVQGYPSCIHRAAPDKLV